MIIRGSSLVGNDSADEDEEDEEFTASRYNPIMKKILRSLVGADDPLSFEDFPSVMPMPEQNASTGAAASARRGKNKKHHGGVEGSARKGGGKGKFTSASGATSKKGVPKTFVGGRSIVFTIGGMSYSEMRIARDIMDQESKEIIFGSTAFVTAKEFVEDLSKLS